MTAIQEYKSKQKWIEQIVLISEPPISSPAALVILSQKYLSSDKSIYTPKRMYSIKRKWIRTMMKQADKKDGLICSICGRKGLPPIHPNRNMVATLDHIIELRNGGSWNDPTNFRIACYKCNLKRA